MSLTLRYMRLPDIQQVAAIDQSCFQPPWSADSYVFEISESRISHMVVLARQLEQPLPQRASQEGWLSNLGDMLRGNAPSLNGRGDIIGYGGLWKIEGEAHISTIATHPQQRGNGYGEILLAGMIGKAMRLKAEFIVLEVRVSNFVAQRLYQKYGFHRIRRMRSYYRNDNEDAWEMRVALDWQTRRRFSELYQSLQGKHLFRDTYSWKGRPWT